MSTWSKSAVLPSKLGAHLPLMEEVLAELERRGWNGRDYFAVQMTLEEVLTNAIRHGNKCEEHKKVSVECRVTDDRFWLEVTDEGPGFRPDLVADCTADENLDRCGGRGMLLINAYMTHVSFNEPGNCITLEKVRGE